MDKGEDDIGEDGYRRGWIKERMDNGEDDIGEDG